MSMLNHEADHDHDHEKYFEKSDLLNGNIIKKNLEIYTFTGASW